MAAGVMNRAPQEAVREMVEDLSFFDKHFAKIAFAISTLALFILQPVALFIGTVAGVFLHYTFEPNPIIADADKIVSVFHATMAIVATVAALIHLTPAGAAGGYLYQSLPCFFSMGIGSVAFSSYRYLTGPSR